MELSLNTQILIGTFLIAAILGAVVNKTNFCTMGAVSDWVNIGDKGRLRAWFLALTVALIGVLAMESMAWVSFDGTRPPYRSANFAWARYLLGGALFGVGMTLASVVETRTWCGSAVAISSPFSWSSSLGCSPT